MRSLEFFKFDLVFLTVSADLVDDIKVSSSTTNDKKRKASVKSEPEINYVGKLLEFCVKNKLPPASFVETEHIPNVQRHLNEFSMKCSVNDVEKQGKGFNKKQAKQMAAMEVLTVLTAGQSKLKDDTKIEAPPDKRLKSIETPTDASSTNFENIVPKVEENGE